VSYPDYLDNYGGDYQHLDAARAQYVAFRWPNVDDFIASNVAKA
jgi:hypothetical protein